MSTLLGLATDKDFMQNVGMLMYLKDNNNDKLLKLTTGLTVASKVMTSLDPNAAKKRREAAYARVAVRINDYKAKNRGAAPNDAWLQVVIKEEFGI